MTARKTTKMLTMMMAYPMRRKVSPHRKGTLHSLEEVKGTRKPFKLSLTIELSS
jgi:hypothetical protein